MKAGSLVRKWRPKVFSVKINDCMNNLVYFVKYFICSLKLGNNKQFNCTCLFVFFFYFPVLFNRCHDLLHKCSNIPVNTASKAETVCSSAGALRGSVPVFRNASPGFLKDIQSSSVDFVQDGPTLGRLRCFWFLQYFYCIASVFVIIISADRLLSTWIQILVLNTSNFYSSYLEKCIYKQQCTQTHYQHFPPRLFLPASRWFWCGPAATPLKPATSFSPRRPCSSGFAACCRSSWTSPSSSRFTTTAATPKSQCPTQFPTPPVPKPSENAGTHSEDTTKQQRGRSCGGAVEMCKREAAWDDAGCCPPPPHFLVYTKTQTCINKAKIQTWGDANVSADTWRTFVTHKVSMFYLLSSCFSRRQHANRNADASKNIPLNQPVHVENIMHTQRS